MKESDYINVSYLTRISAVLDILRGICAANSEIIDQPGLTKIFQVLTDWQERLFDAIKD